MSALARQLPKNVEPDQLPILPPPKTIADAVAHIHQASQSMAKTLSRLECLVERFQTETPEFKAIAINDGDSGQYVVTDVAKWEAKSIGVINPTSVACYLGIAGVSATSTSRAIAVAPMSFLVLPVLCGTLELGCDPTALEANTAVVYLLRFQTVQPLNVQLLGV